MLLFACLNSLKPVYGQFIIMNLTSWCFIIISLSLACYDLIDYFIYFSFGSSYKSISWNFSIQHLNQTASTSLKMNQWGGIFSHSASTVVSL